MKLHTIIALLSAAILNFAHAVPAGSGDLLAQPLVDTVAFIDPTDPTTTLTINGTTALSTGILTRDPVPGICFLNIGLVEHFPRGGSLGRRASIFVGALKDGANNDIWRIGNYTIRIYYLIRRGDSLSFEWVHLDDNHPEQEWVDFDFNNQKWNDRDTDCSKEIRNIVYFYAMDGKPRVIKLFPRSQPSQNDGPVWGVSTQLCRTTRNETALLYAHTRPRIFTYMSQVNSYLDTFVHPNPAQTPALRCAELIIKLYVFRTSTQETDFLPLMRLVARCDRDIKVGILVGDPDWGYPEAFAIQRLLKGCSLPGPESPDQC
ncbi:hypothetical protein E8E11_005051 [Didymella keratinophila]|nr:hypothetical protein E8E11_005051 [Didymella keratinophila]